MQGFTPQGVERSEHIEIIKGCKFAWNVPKQSPQLVMIGGDLWLPAFNTIEELVMCMQWLGRESYEIITINDPEEFMEFLTEEGIQLCLNLRRVDGVLHFARVALDAEEPLH